jgi:hypothetical protein
MMSRNSVRPPALDHGPTQAACIGNTRTVPFHVACMRSRTTRGKETKMNRLALLIPMVLACPRTPLGLHATDGGSPGAGGAGGSAVVPPATGGSLGNGGAGGGMGGAPSGSGDSRAAGGVTGTGGSISASGGSVSTSAYQR